MAQFPQGYGQPGIPQYPQVYGQPGIAQYPQVYGRPGIISPFSPAQNPYAAVGRQNSWSSICLCCLPRHGSLRNGCLTVGIIILILGVFRSFLNALSLNSDRKKGEHVVSTIDSWALTLEPLIGSFVHRGIPYDWNRSLFWIAIMGNIFFEIIPGFILVFAALQLSARACIIYTVFAVLSTLDSMIQCVFTLAVVPSNLPPKNRPNCRESSNKLPSVIEYCEDVKQLEAVRTYGILFSLLVIAFRSHCLAYGLLLREELRVQYGPPVPPPQPVMGIIPQGPSLGGSQGKGQEPQKSSMKMQQSQQSAQQPARQLGQPGGS